jgi:hypothetical protein
MTQMVRNVWYVLAILVALAAAIPGWAQERRTRFEVVH